MIQLQRYGRRTGIFIEKKGEWAISENIHTFPMDDTELSTYKFQDFQEGQQQFLQDSRAC